MNQIEELAALSALPVDEIKRRLRVWAALVNAYTARHPYPCPMRPGMVAWPTRRRRHRR